MPGPTVEIANPIRTETHVVSLEPAINAFNSLSLLNKAEYLYGLDDWVTRTLAAMPSEQLHTHRVVFWGLYYAIEPRRSYPSFAAYLGDLERQAPVTLRDRVLEAYARFPLLKSVADDPSHQPAPTDAKSLLADSRVYLQYLSERFHSEHYDEAIELESHRWMNDPAGMKDLIVSHVRAMWNEYMADEWERTRRLLADCVEAYRQIDLSGLSSLEAAQKVVGRELDEHWQKMLKTAQRVIFVPSAHVGPYLMKIGVDQTLYMLFGARQPAGVLGTSPDLGRSELLVRLVALADDTRLRILDLLARRGEMCSPDIIRELDLSQSAASRHLQQLSATGYLTERRREGAKCFSLNVEQIDHTFGALARFLRKTG